MANSIIPYRKDLKERARQLRKNQTRAEKLIWEKSRRKVLGVELHRQVPLVDYKVDFYCHEIGLAIEIDGPSHETQFLEDAKRAGRIEEYGVRFMRFKNNEIYQNLKNVIDRIREEIDESLG